MYELMTAWTDYILAYICFRLGTKLAHKGIVSQETAVKLWSMGFYALSMAAITGWVMHGFVSPEQPYFKLLLWKVTVAFIGIGNSFLVSALLIAVSRKWKMWVLLNSLSIIGHVFLLFVAYEFILVIMHTGWSIATMYFLCFKIQPNNDGRSPVKYLILGLSISLAGLIIQQSGRLILGIWFNYDALYHVIQMGAMYFLYSGGLLLNDASHSSIK